MRDSDPKTDDALANKSNGGHSSGNNTAAIYAGLISHSQSDESDGEVDDAVQGSLEEEYADDKDVDENPDFMASDSPPDDYQSV